MSTHIDKFLGDVVAAGATNLDLSPIVPNGKRIYIDRFGCFCRCPIEQAIVAIQWGDQTGGFQTIRAIGGIFEISVDRTFVGDGVKRFRLVRQNKGSTAFEIAAWFEAIVKD